MPDDEHAEAGARRSQFVLVAASAVGVIVFAAAVIGVRSWCDTAARIPAADGPPPAASSGSPLASSVASLSAIPGSEPAFSSTPIVSPAPISTPSPQPTTAPSSSRTSAAGPGIAGDNQPNFKVSIQASPTQVVLGQQVRVTVTIVNAGGVFDRSVDMSFGGSDPSDNFSDAPPPCTARSGSVSCPITGLLPAHKTSFTFTFIPGPFPAMGHFDDAVYAVFDYTDRHGQPQQTPQYFANVLLFDAPASSPPASGGPSNMPPVSTPPASAASTSATSAP